MAKYQTITYTEMREFLEDKGFRQIHLPNTVEFVFARGHKGWVFGNDKLSISIRVYTSVHKQLGISRDTGKDAIRVTLWAKRNDNPPFMLHSDKRVHRVEGWRSNLKERLDNWHELLGELCPTCGCPMLIKINQKRREPFLGCVRYPTCLGTRSYNCDHSAAYKRSVTCPDCGVNLKEKRSPII